MHVAGARVHVSRSARVSYYITTHPLYTWFKSLLEEIKKKEICIKFWKQELCIRNNFGRKNMYSAQNLGSKFYYPKDVKCQAYKYLKNVCQNLVNRNKTKIPSTWMGDHLAHEEPELEAI